MKGRSRTGKTGKKGQPKTGAAENPAQPAKRWRNWHKGATGAQAPAGTGQSTTENPFPYRTGGKEKPEICPAKGKTKRKTQGALTPCVFYKDIRRHAESIKKYFCTGYFSM